MNKNWRVATQYGVLGTVVARLELAYLLIFHANGSSWLMIISLLICPSSVFTIVFIDIHPTNSQIASLWLIIAILNGIIYGWAASIIFRLFWKSG